MESRIKKLEDGFDQRITALEENILNPLKFNKMS